MNFKINIFIINIFYKFMISLGIQNKNSNGFQYFEVQNTNTDLLGQELKLSRI